MYGSHKQFLSLLPEIDRAGIRAVNHDVADSAVQESPTRVSQVMEGRSRRPFSLFARGPWRVRMAFKTEEPHFIALEELGIGRAVWRVADLAAFDLDRGVFVNKRPGLVAVTSEAGDVAVGPRPQLFIDKAAVLVMAIGALHPAFGDLMVKRTRERSFLFAVASITTFWFRFAEQILGAFGRMR